jgi:hypothetical protein
VIDNYWDIWFATELLLSFEKRRKWKYHFRIFTDNKQIVSDFFEKNNEYLPSFEIAPLDESSIQWLSSIVFLLFHFPIPKITDRERHLILRIDYLSFDPIWVENNGKEHILSTPDVPIIEIIPSLFWSWTIDPFLPAIPSRDSFLKRFSLPQELQLKKWISLFTYHETFQKIDFSHISSDWIIFVLGWDQKIEHPQVVYLPFLSIADFHTLIALSDFNFVRWEESALAAMKFWKPFLWDMYKWHGWFSYEISTQFLDFFEFSELYRKIHLDYNCGKDLIRIQDIIHVLEVEQCFQRRNELHEDISLVETLEKYIDRFYFSL